MAFGGFKNLGAVALKYQIVLRPEPFIQPVPMTVDEGVPASAGIQPAERARGGLRAGDFGVPDRSRVARDVARLQRFPDDLEPCRIRGRYAGERLPRLLLLEAISSGSGSRSAICPVRRGQVRRVRSRLGTMPGGHARRATDERAGGLGDLWQCFQWRILVLRQVARQDAVPGSSFVYIDSPRRNVRRVELRLPAIETRITIGDCGCDACSASNPTVMRNSFRETVAFTNTVEVRIPPAPIWLTQSRVDSYSTRIGFSSALEGSRCVLI